MTLPRVSRRPIVTTISGRCPALTSATESRMISARWINPCTASIVASATICRGVTVAVRPVATPVRWVPPELSCTCARVTSACGSQLTVSNFSLAFIVPSGCRVVEHTQTHPEARFMPGEMAGTGYLGAVRHARKKRSPARLCGACRSTLRSLVVASPRDAGVQEILLCLQARVQPHEGDQNPPAEEDDGEEDRGVHPEALGQIPTRAQKQRPPVDMKPGWQGLVIQGGQGIVLPVNADLEIQEPPHLAPERPPNSPYTLPQPPHGRRRYSSCSDFSSASSSPPRVRPGRSSGASRPAWRSSIVTSISRQMAQVPRRRPCWQRSAAVRARTLRTGVRVARAVARAVAVLPNPFTAFTSSGLASPSN